MSQKIGLKKVIVSDGVRAEQTAENTVVLRLTNQKFSGATVETVAYVPIVDEQYPEDKSVIKYASRVEGEKLLFELPLDLSLPVLVLALQADTDISILSPMNREILKDAFGVDRSIEPQEFWKRSGATWAQSQESFDAASTQRLDYLDAPEGKMIEHEQHIVSAWLDNVDNAFELIYENHEYSFLGAL